MTHLRKITLEELQRRNYSQNTVGYYVRAVGRFAKHFGKPPDQLKQEHLREYQAYLRNRTTAASLFRAALPTS